LSGADSSTKTDYSHLSFRTSQFFVTTAKCDFLDGKHVVFGRVIDGMLTLRKIENVPTGPNNRPKLVVKITGRSFGEETYSNTNNFSRVRRNVVLDVYN
jgi:hypothetical protein